MTNRHLVRGLDQVGIGDRPLVGGKGASVGEVVRTGVRVTVGHANSR